MLTKNRCSDKVCIQTNVLEVKVMFNKYKNNGYIEVFDGEYRKDYYVDNIIFEEGFYI